MCIIEPYVQPHDDLLRGRADAMTVSPAAEALHGGTNPMKRQGGSTAMTTLFVADARKPSESSGVGGHCSSPSVHGIGSDGRKVTIRYISPDGDESCMWQMKRKDVYIVNCKQWLVIECPGVELLVTDEDEVGVKVFAHRKGDAP